MRRLRLVLCAALAFACVAHGAAALDTVNVGKSGPPMLLSLVELGQDAGIWTGVGLTERGTRLEMIRIRPDAAATLAAGDGRILTFTVAGAGTCGSELWSRHSAAEIAPGESARIAADESAELLVISLPKIRVTQI